MSDLMWSSLRHNLNLQWNDQCGVSQWPGEPSVFSANAAEADDAGAGGVEVLDSGTVGNYQYVTLDAASAEQLLEWLNENDYGIPEALEPALQPYIGGAHFVAFKLVPGTTTVLPPIKFTMPGLSNASIPIRLTGIAATDDMEVITYLGSESRAIPVNYLDVTPNDAVMDWSSLGWINPFGAWQNTPKNYVDIITMAVDQADGRGMVTEYAGESQPMTFSLGDPTQVLNAIKGSTTLEEVIMHMLNFGVPRDATTQSLIQEAFPVPPEVTEAGYDNRSFYNSSGWIMEQSGLDPTKYFETYEVDVEQFAENLNTIVYEPLEAIDALYKNVSYMTRMYTTLSPAEMKVDPLFEFNSDQNEDVSNVHTASGEYFCAEDGSFILKVILEDGTILYYEADENSNILPPFYGYPEDGAATGGVLADGVQPATKIQVLSTNKAPLIVTNDTQAQAEFFQRKAQEFENKEENAPIVNSPSSLGCQLDRTGSKGSALLVLALLAGLAISRRRRNA